VSVMETKRPRSDRIRRAGPLIAQAQGGANGIVGLTAEDMVPAHLLDGGEIVLFAIKPSIWFILIVSLRWVAVGFIGSVAAAWQSVPFGSDSRWYLYQLGFVIAGGRLAWAVLEWVSRLYVLTNRRVMRIRGVFRVELFECALTRIQNTHVVLAVSERMTRTGTIRFQTAAGQGAAAWRIVARPLEVHEQLREAIRRAHLKGQNGL